MQEMTVDSTEHDREYVCSFALIHLKPVLIDNIFFDFDRATLRPESTESLDELVMLLENNPGVTIEIGAHCDYKGNDNYHRRLSQQRSESVVQYLIAHGIDKERLTAHGYGETQPKVISRKIAEEHDFLNEGDTLTEEFILKLSMNSRKSATSLTAGPNSGSLGLPTACSDTDQTPWKRLEHSREPDGLHFKTFRTPRKFRYPEHGNASNSSPNTSKVLNARGSATPGIHVVGAVSNS